MIELMRRLQKEARALKSAATDIVRYAEARFRIRKFIQSGAAGHALSTINVMVLGAESALMEAKKNLAVLKADYQRALKALEHEAGAAPDRRAQAKWALVGGDAAAASEAERRAAATEHERAVARKRAELEYLANHVNQVVRELRRIDAAIRLAKDARDQWYAERSVADARASAAAAAAQARGLATMMEAASAMAMALNPATPDDSPRRTANGGN
ncbi:hypothetical protein [Sorangium sp. So ce693]|uniref:hypothetical protein n=1 Tax=Sorangium sp. So ce693 TaxID=3133318 RepID=UPI003F612710